MGGLGGNPKKVQMRFQRPALCLTKCELTHGTHRSSRECSVLPLWHYDVPSLPTQTKGFSQTTPVLSKRREDQRGRVSHLGVSEMFSGKMGTETSQGWSKEQTGNKIQGTPKASAVTADFTLVITQRSLLLSPPFASGFEMALYSTLLKTFRFCLYTDF